MLVLAAWNRQLRGKVPNGAVLKHLLAAAEHRTRRENALESREVQEGVWQSCWS